MKTFNRMLAIILAVMVLCMAFAVCSAQDKTVVRILAGQSTTDAGTEDMMKAAIEKAYPELDIQFECVEWGGDLTNKVQMYAQSEMPDIIIGKAQDVATYGGMGLLADLSAEPYMSEVLDAAKPGVTLDGKLMGVVYNTNYQGVYYSKALFDEYGLTAPDTFEQLQTIIDVFKANDIYPFASHMIDTWSIGNVTMQFAVNDVFNTNPTWGDDFRAGKVSFATDEGYRHAYEYNKLIFDNTWTDETFSTEQTTCDARMVTGEAAMKVSGSWSIQNFLAIDETFDFGIFPFPNQTGDAKLLFEPNLTFMVAGKNYEGAKKEAIDKVLNVITGDKDLGVEMCNFTGNASMIKGVTPTFPNPSQADVDKYAGEGRIQDVSVGNNQLTWGGFQEENANDIAAWLLDDMTIEDALKAADARVEASSAS